MSDGDDTLLHWIARQRRLSVAGMLRAVSATDLVKARPLLAQTIRPVRGSILASPEIASYDPNPDYFFHWLRDSAIIIDALRELITDGTLGPSAVDHLVDFTRFSLQLCQLDGPSFLRESGGFRERADPSFLKNVRSEEEIAQIVGDRALGEVRYNADGGFDLIRWSRPQNDGPALRVLAVLRFFKLKAFRERAGEAATALLRCDLDYTRAHWREPCFDLWEEVRGLHYYTRLVQYAALAEGSDFLAASGDFASADACRRAAQELFSCLDAHFVPADGIYVSRLPEPQDQAGAPARRLDIATLLAVAHTKRSEGRHSVLDPKMLATVAQIEALFERDYRINRERPAHCAPALGRYAGDVYFSGGAYYFSTLGAAEFYYLLAQAVGVGREVEVTPGNRALLAALLREPPEQLPEGLLAAELKERLREGAIARGDGFMAMVRAHTPASGELSEQFDQNDGAQTSAKNLAWSYACFITAASARARALKA